MNRKAILSILLLGSLAGSTIPVKAGSIFDEPSTFEYITETISDASEHFKDHFPIVFLTTLVSVSAYFLADKIVKTTWKYGIETPYYSIKHKLFTWYYTIQANRILNNKTYFQEKVKKEGKKITLSSTEILAINTYIDAINNKDDKKQPSENELTAINLCLQMAGYKKLALGTSK